jgi:Flp pilus assembly protein TadD
MKSTAALACKTLRAAAALTGAGMLACLPSAAQQAQPPLAAAPPHLQAFLREALAANAIPDPLQRCLAFPDLPGNVWPPGLARAHCHLYFDPQVTAAMLSAALERKAYAELEARFQADLDLHYADKREPSEVIHADFDAFDGSDESDRLSKLWLEQSPRSAFALTARGAHLGNLAFNVRGTAWASKTPPEQMNRMAFYAQQAMDLFARALEREPRLIVAAEMQIHVGMLGGHDEQMRKALLHGEFLDPACHKLTQRTLQALRPRWGGSYRAMAAYASTLLPHLRQRPLLALSIAEIAIDRADTGIDKNQHADIIAYLKPVAQASTAWPVYESLAMAYNRQNDGATRWEALSYQLEWLRFSPHEPAPHREAGRTLVNLGQLEWALPLLRKAVALQRSDTDAQLLLGRLYLRLQREAEAEAPLLAAMAGPDERGDALNGLMVLAARAHKDEAAWHYVELLNAEFPAFAWPWFVRAMLLDRQGKDGVEAALEKYVQLADAADPGEAGNLEFAYRRLAAAPKK